jgi:hypothetical protein
LAWGDALLLRNFPSKSISFVYKGDQNTSLLESVYKFQVLLERLALKTREYTSEVSLFKVFSRLVGSSQEAYNTG